MNGNYGCEIWFSTVLPFLYLHDKPKFVNKDSIGFLYYDPRRLFVECSVACASFVCVSLHAPYVGCKEEHHEWWKVTIKLCDKYLKNKSCLFFFDANLHIPECCLEKADGTSGNFSFGKKWSGEAYDTFATLLAKPGLSIFETFEPNLKSASYDNNSTYFSKSGQSQFVYDHICAIGMCCIKGSYEVWNEVVSLCDGVDHLPVWCKVKWHNNSSFCYNKRRVIPYDRNKIGDEDCDAIFRECLSLCPSIPFFFDTTSHSWILNKCFVNAAMIAYPHDLKRKHQQYITKDTFALI